MKPFRTQKRRSQRPKSLHLNSTTATNEDDVESSTRVMMRSKSLCVGTVSLATATQRLQDNSDDVNDNNKSTTKATKSMRSSPFLSQHIAKRDTETTETASLTSTTAVATTSAETLPSATAVTTTEPDMYGQVHPIETPALIRAKLHEFNVLLQERYVAMVRTRQHERQRQQQKKRKPSPAKKLVPKQASSAVAVDDDDDSSTPGLLQAMEAPHCPDHHDDAFRLQFLRCEVFCTARAVQRYARYWEERVKLCRSTTGSSSGDRSMVSDNDITKATSENHATVAFQRQSLNTMTEQDMAALQDGMLQLVGGDNASITDPMGRAILYLCPEAKDMTQYSRQHIVRACAYVITAALQRNVTTQQRGAVILFDTQHTTFSAFDLQLERMLITGIQGKMPLRLAAVHACHPQPFARIIIPLIKVFMPERLRRRIQFHKGRNEDILERLKVYGLTPDVVPTELGGNVQLDHVGWLRERQAKGL